MNISDKTLYAGVGLADVIASYGNAATEATSDYYLDGADTPTVGRYPAYVHIALQDAQGESVATSTVYSTGGVLPDVNLASDSPRRLLIDVYKSAGASFPIVRVYNNQDMLVTENTADNSHVGYSIEINGTSYFTVQIANWFKQSDGQMGDAVDSEFHIATAVSD